MTSNYLLMLTVLLVIPVVALTAAESRPITPGQTNFSKGEYEVTTDTLFNEPVTFEEGAVLNVAKGVTVTFNSTFAAGEGQVFAGEGTVAGLHKLTPEWFGAKGDGVTDDTAAFQKTLDSFPNHGFGETDYKGNFVLLLRKKYLLNSVSIDSTYVNIQSENAWLIAKETGKYPYLIRFTQHFCSINGYLSIEGSYNLGYECMVNVNTRHFTSHNVHIWRANLAWRFGNIEWGVTNESPGMSEKGDSEIEIIGGATIHGLRGIEAIGSNTIITFTDALVYSYPWTLADSDPRKAAWESADSTLIRSYGAFIYYTGGQLANFTPSVAMVEVQPVKNTMAEYFSQYGAVFICNTHIEGGNFFITANPKKIKQQDYQGKALDPAGNVALWMIGCGGYVTGSQIPVNTDPLFTGTVIFSDCNFYGAPATTFAKIGNPRATIKVDNVTLRNKWSNGLTAIEGGAPVFDNRTVLEAAMLKSQSISKQSVRVKFGNFVSTQNTGHFRACYNAETGVFTVPERGLDQVTVTANVNLAGNNAGTVRLALLKNNKEITATTSSGPSGSISYKFSTLSAGDTLSIAARTVSGTKQITAGEGTQFTIEASRF